MKAKSTHIKAISAPLRYWGVPPESFRIIMMRSLIVIILYPFLILVASDESQMISFIFSITLISILINIYIVWHFARSDIHYGQKTIGTKFWKKKNKRLLSHMQPSHYQGEIQK